MIDYEKNKSFYIDLGTKYDNYNHIVSRRLRYIDSNNCWNLEEWEDYNYLYNIIYKTSCYFDKNNNYIIKHYSIPMTKYNKDD